MPDPTTPEAFRFDRAGVIASDELATLRTLEEGFARKLTHVLGAWLRTSVAVVPLEPEQQAFGTFADRVAAGCHVLPLELSTQGQEMRGVLSLSLALAPTVIDLLLGGSGRAPGLARELTEIEGAVLGSAMDLVLREWGAAWAPCGLELQAGKRERESHGQRLMPARERVFCCRFQITLAELSGELLFCLPSAAITTALRAVAHRGTAQRQRAPEERSRMLHRLRVAGVHATLQFPPMRLGTADLHALRAGSLLPLPLARGVPAELRVGGVGVFRAEPVRSGGHRAARVIHTLDGNRQAEATA